MASVEEWELLLRRSFEIPDLIGTETAKALLAECALGDHSADKALHEWNRHDPRETVGQVSRTIAALGAEGKLDETIIDLPRCDTLGEKAREINSKALGNPNLEAELERAGGGAKPLLVALQAFVLAHPFTDPLGPRQFGEPSADLAQ